MSVQVGQEALPCLLHIIHACLIADYGIQEPLLTYCGEYGRFCCGSDKAARECCDSTNSTLRVNVTSGDPIYWKQSDGQNKSLKTTRNVLIALTAGFGTAFLVAGWFAYRGRQGLKHQDQSWSELERERQRKLAAQQNLEKLESALKQVIIPPDVRREIENARGPQVPVDSMELEQDEFIAGRPRN